MGAGTGCPGGPHSLVAETDMSANRCNDIEDALRVTCQVATGIAADTSHGVSETGRTGNLSHIPVFVMLSRVTKIGGLLAKELVPP